jgi:hypothetical protein
MRAARHSPVQANQKWQKKYQRHSAEVICQYMKWRNREKEKSRRLYSAAAASEAIKVAAHHKEQRE